jgi:hypothetical protein
MLPHYLLGVCALIPQLDVSARHFSHNQRPLLWLWCRRRLLPQSSSFLSHQPIHSSPQTPTRAPISTGPLVVRVALKRGQRAEAGLAISSGALGHTLVSPPLGVCFVPFVHASLSCPDRTSRAPVLLHLCMHKCARWHHLETHTTSTQGARYVGLVHTPLPCLPARLDLSHPPLCHLHVHAC